ncbi:hypothetical protein H5410_005907 [Solanum commersonii]|uniref:Uncharacterized protein n=1 Tax=Solanum commersonii TaxID=4109 RepID=A0A9J6A861_SOLCO|nr:hypothetical protein H5410_005907 [Solanum commersonii]
MESEIQTLNPVFLLVELIAEILLRLQVKYLLKFNVLMFDSHENNLMDCSVSSLFYDHVTRIIDLDYPAKISYESIKLVGSVNGVICVAIKEKDLNKLSSSETGFFYMNGFGYNALHNDYKVMVIYKNVGDDNLHYNVGKIYSLNNNSWKRLYDLQM